MVYITIASVVQAMYLRHRNRIDKYKLNYINDMENDKIRISELSNKLLLHATMSDFIEAIRISRYEKNSEETFTESSSCSKHYVYGLAGLAKLLGCSPATAQRIKSSGILDAAISQHSRTIIVDADLALELMRVNGKRE